MMVRLLHLLRRFARNESGNATVEFVITFPLVLMTLASAFEVGSITMNTSMLERAVDVTVRDIRLGTGTAPQHDVLKDRICERANFINDCNDLRLEMVRIDPRAWVSPEAEADCTDKSEEVAPVRNFVNGRDNELMILRVCAKFDPIFPHVGLGRTIQKDGAGQYAIVTASAFVQEPR